MKLIKEDMYISGQAKNQHLEVNARLLGDTGCRPVREGGLNIKNMEAQNICFLLKFVHKLPTGNSSSWANWIHTFIYKR
jgi:hypothetical protein